MVQGDVVGIIKCKVKILEDLSKEEAFGVINESTAFRGIDIVYSSIGVVYFQDSVEAIECAPRPVQVFDIAGRTEGVKIGFEDLGPKNIIRSGDVEPIFLIEG